jgi:hypothetical protein
MFEILILLVVFIIGFYVGESIFAYRIRHLIYKEAKAQGILIDLDGEESKPTIDKLFVECTNDMMYLYEYEAHTFICQGKTLGELARLAQKYKNIKYAIVQHNEEMLMFVDGSVKEKE